jgi:iron complex outermembrane recepter protein
VSFASPEFVLLRLAPNDFVTQAQQNLGTLPPQISALLQNYAALFRLKPETSTSYSLGVVWRPSIDVLATLDAYQLTVSGRISDSELYTSGNLPALITLLGFTPGLSNEYMYAYNGRRTRTRGVDFTLRVPLEYSSASVELVTAATYSKTSITDKLAPVDDEEIVSLLTSAFPLYVLNLGGTLTWHKLAINLLEKMYGPSSYERNRNGTALINLDVKTQQTHPGDYANDAIPFTPITNIDIAYDLSKKVRIDAGALNLFNAHPPLLDPSSGFNGFGDASVYRYSVLSPFGINGGSYYARVTVSF